MKEIGSHLGSRVRPLFWHDGELFVERDGKVCRCVSHGSLEVLFELPQPRLRQLLNRSRLLYRLRRAGVFSAIRDGKTSFYSWRRSLYRFSHTSQRLELVRAFDVGHGPLAMAGLSVLDGGADGVAFGEYFHNPSRAPVKLYRWHPAAGLEVVHEFHSGEVNHIHNLVVDRENRCIWVMAGDFGQAASLWRFSVDFTEHVCVARGDQTFRACVGFPTAAGLLYATDTQLMPNSIRLGRYEQGNWKTEPIAGLNGPCIFGCELKDYYIFSTATEPRVSNGNRLGALFDNQPAPAIEENASTIVACEKATLVCKTLATYRKDSYPYRLFQFGNILFPGGKAPGNELYAYLIGSRDHDLAMRWLDIDHLFRNTPRACGIPIQESDAH